MVSIFCEGYIDAVVLRYIIENRTNMTIGVDVHSRGKGYIEERLRSLNRSAQGHPIIVLLDQDGEDDCPNVQTARMLGGAVRNENLLVRFAKLEIESWIMADRESLAMFLDVGVGRIPEQVERVDNPKQTLVNIARQSRSRQIRDAIVPSASSAASVGPLYNMELSRFVRTNWRLNVACEGSQSLRRSLERIIELERRIGP